MAWTPDFRVDYHPERGDEPRDLSPRVIKSLVVNRIKNNKPCVMFIGGDSGEGKSWGALRIQEVIADLLNYDLMEDETLHVQNVYTPIQYTQKLEKLLHDPVYRKARVICLHESRNIISSKDWANFVSQALADVNAMSRSVKPLVFMIISQFIRDITRDMRYTLNYYIRAMRPQGRATRMFWSKVWKDDRDLEKPRLRKRKVRGHLRTKDGYRRFRPDYFEMNKPAKHIREAFEQRDTAAKAMIMRRKTEKMEAMLKDKFDLETPQVEEMVEYYSKNPEYLDDIGKRKKGSGEFLLNQDFKRRHDLTKTESQEFLAKLKETLKTQL